MAKALEGIRVLDFSHMYAGPLGGMFLAELGADVIKIEVPQGGDAVRNTAPLTEGQESYRYITLNRGKRGITLNLRSEEGKRIIRELVERSDVLLENFTPGVMEGFGLSYEDLKPYNPRLIYASISGFGHTGPYSSLMAFDTIIQAMGGLISVNGHPDTPPTKVGPSVADILGGIFSAFSILAALQYRNRTNQGQFVDLSMQDCIWLITSMQFLPLYMTTGKEPQRLGNRQLEVTPFNIYKARDGWIVIATVTVGQFERLMDVIGRPELKKVPEYATQVTRIHHVEEIDAVVEEWTKKRTVDEMIKHLRAADLPCSTVPSFGQVANDPQLASRDMLIEVEQLISGKVKLTGSVFKMSESPGDPTQPAPFLGQHNAEVYSELLGYDRKTIARLQRDGVI